METAGDAGALEIPVAERSIDSNDGRRVAELVPHFLKGLVEGRDIAVG